MRFSVRQGEALHERCLDVVYTRHDFELTWNLHFFSLRLGSLPALEHIASKIPAILILSPTHLALRPLGDKTLHLSAEDLIS